MAKGSSLFAGDSVVAEFPKHDRPLVKYPEVKMTAASPMQGTRRVRVAHPTQRIPFPRGTHCCILAVVLGTVEPRMRHHEFSRIDSFVIIELGQWGVDIMVSG